MRLTPTQTLEWYDGPILLTARDFMDVPFIVMAVNDPRFKFVAALVTPPLLAEFLDGRIDLLTLISGRQLEGGDYIENGPDLEVHPIQPEPHLLPDPGLYTGSERFKTEFPSTIADAYWETRP